MKSKILKLKIIAYKYNIIKNLIKNIIKIKQFFNLQ